MGLCATATLESERYDRDSISFDRRVPGTDLTGLVPPPKKNEKATQSVGKPFCAWVFYNFSIRTLLLATGLLYLWFAAFSFFNQNRFFGVGII